MKQVFTKSRKRYGKVYPSQPTKYHVSVERNKSITIFEDGKETSSFNIGDTVVYDSYNLYYTGTIIQISETSVTVEEPYKMYGSDHGRRHRMPMERFCWRNSGLDLERINKENFETSHYI
jgi:hypothetical protein